MIENVEFGLKLRGIAAGRAAQDARRRSGHGRAGTLGLSSCRSELSGGMRQRVGLARALATDADVLIMDEAFSALDPLIRTEMQDELLRLQRTLNKTILFITHDFQEALKLGTRIAIMSDGSWCAKARRRRSCSIRAAITSPRSRAKSTARRLFDAGSVMTSLAADRARADGIARLAGASGQPGPGFDARRRSNASLGTVPRLQHGQARGGALCPGPTRASRACPAHTKLVDVAGLPADGGGQSA